MKTITFAFLLFLSPNIFSQGWKEYIVNNALPVGTNLSVNSSLYAPFEKYRFIAVGEMHGTKEPAKITEQLARLILVHEESVSVGLEIPEKEMKDFLQKPNEKTLMESRFFSKPNEDGRNSSAWYNLIQYCMNEPRIHLFFYDNATSSDVSRDSIMYLEIKKQALSHPTNKILTLSGNIHNQLTPFNDEQTMISYLSEDPYFPKGCICSIYHYYAEGTMMNNRGNGLELRTIEFQESDFTSGLYENYFLFYTSAEPTPNNCIFFTRKVHHSESLDFKN
ncbi:hypothetical protein [Fluviicola taffensis]|uniref:hypothetical protein n=1 Tax=Fluviicola taffensis TaxID=191579 RepID=UPI003137A859